MSHRHRGGGEREQIEDDLSKDKERMWGLAATQLRGALRRKRETMGLCCLTTCSSFVKTKMDGEA
jgi:hypothetical protein